MDPPAKGMEVNLAVTLGLLEVSTLEILYLLSSLEQTSDQRANDRLEAVNGSE